jgi:4-hydroxy-3-polyprenylbenzoate decarboxylase
MRNKLLILVDDDVDLHNEHEVWQSVAQHADMGRDLLLDEGPLERALTIDATRKLPGERQQPSPQRIAASAEVQQLVNERWAEYGLP